ncbi:MAG: TraB/GumN family protein, partial [Pseudomonadota bacterium]
RNQNWMPQILRELARGDAVIAVGALHLSGPDSLQVMLEAEGYSITRLDLTGASYDVPADPPKQREIEPEVSEDAVAPGDPNAPEKKSK